MYRTGNILILLLFLSQVWAECQCVDLDPRNSTYTESYQLLPSFHLKDSSQWQVCSAYNYHDRYALSSNGLLNDDWFYIPLSDDELEILEIDNSQTDRIDIYKASENTFVKVLSGGDAVPWSMRKWKHRNIIYELEGGGQGLFFHIQNRGSYIIPLKFYKAENFRHFDNSRSLLIGMYIGMVLLFLMFTLIAIYLTRYDRSQIYYLGYLFFTGLYFLVELGYGDIYIWRNNPQWEETGIFILIILSAVSLLLFSKSIFGISRLNKKLNIVHQGLLIISSLFFVTLIIGFIKNDGFFTFYYPSILWYVLLIFLASVVYGCFAIKRKQPYARYFLMAILFMVIGSAVKPLSLNGLLPYSTYAQYGGMVGQSLEIITISILLLIINIRKIRRSGDLKTQAVELKSSALQAQMNPHFIFNSLNSIQRFIATNDKMQAMDYLSKFALLIRKTLNASSKNNITLDEEISIIKHYLDLEKLRFKEKFNYSITIDSQIDTEDFYVPPLLLQPFVENSIKHGFKKKDNDGRIEVKINQSGDDITIKIRDNGIGLQDADSSHASMGLKLTRQRLYHHNKRSLISDLHVENRKDGNSGVDVFITIAST